MVGGETVTVTRRAFIKGAVGTVALVVAGPLVTTPREELWPDTGTDPIADIGNWVAQLHLQPPNRFTEEDIRRAVLAVPRVTQVRITPCYEGPGTVLVEVDRNVLRVVRRLEEIRPMCVDVGVQVLV